MLIVKCEIYTILCYLLFSDKQLIIDNTSLLYQLRVEKTYPLFNSHLAN